MLPTFKEKVAAVYIDVDLASSTRTCLNHLYPLLERGGVCFSQGKGSGKGSVSLFHNT